MKVIWRAEQGYIIAYNLATNDCIEITKKTIPFLNQWLNTGQLNKYIQMLIEKGFINIKMLENEKEELKQLVGNCTIKKAPLRSLCAPEIMNIELTSRCPLRCPQCYCDLYKGKDIDKEIAFKYIEQAARLKIPFINLSGGETLIYPYLNEIVEFINNKGLCSAISISGWGFNLSRLKELVYYGVDEIYVSLNGSTKEINDKSRDGYNEAINALTILKANQHIDYFINWVARNDNIDDFDDLVTLAKRFSVKGVVILESKPDASCIVQSTLSKDNFLKLANYIKNHDQKEIEIVVEPCSSPLRAYTNNNFLYNLNIGVNKGCGAGRNAMAVDVDGKLIPCRHLLYPENYDDIEAYWWQSEILNKLRRFEDELQEEPCQTCYLNKNCISCRAIADKVENNLSSSNKYCAVGVK